MKKILTILIVLLWITSAWSGWILDNGSGGVDDSVVIEWNALDNNGNFYLATWDSVYICHIYHGVDSSYIFWDTLTTGYSNFDYTSPNGTGYAGKFFRHRRLSSTSSSAGAYGVKVIAVEGSVAHTLSEMNYQVNDVGLGDFLVLGDTGSCKASVSGLMEKGDSSTCKADVSALMTKADSSTCKADVSTLMEKSDSSTCKADVSGLSTLTENSHIGIDATDVTGSFAAGAFGAGCLNGKGDWNIGKTGYTLTQLFPTNFADLSITLSTGRVAVGTSYDKSGYSLTQSFPSNFADLAITPSTGLVDINTKTGFSLLASQWTDHRTTLNSAHGSGSWLTAAGFSTHDPAGVYAHFISGNNEDQFKAVGFSTFNPASEQVDVGKIAGEDSAAINLREAFTNDGVVGGLYVNNYADFKDKASQSDIQGGMTAQGYTVARAPYLDNINHGIPSSVNYTPTRATYLDYLDVEVSSRLAATAMPTNWGNLLITAGGYASPNFSDVNGDLDSTEIKWRNMFSMKMGQYTTKDTTFGYANNPNNFVDSTTYSNWQNAGLNEIAAYLGSQAGCDSVKVYLYPIDGSVPKDSVIIWCKSGGDSTRVAKKQYFKNGANTVVDSALYMYFGY